MTTEITIIIIAIIVALCYVLTTILNYRKVKNNQYQNIYKVIDELDDRVGNNIKIINNYTCITNEILKKSKLLIEKVEALKELKDKQ